MKFLMLILALSIQSSVFAESDYKKFGEKKKIVKVVDDMMINLLADKRTKKFFEFTDNDHIKKMLVEQFCVVLKGPCKYTGADMKESHKDLEIARGDFYALVEQLQKAMDSNNISQSAQTALLSKLAVMHKDIVNK